MSSGHHHRSHAPSPEWQELRPEVKRRLADPKVRERILIDYEIDSTFDIAYIAGISNDHCTIYIDRHFPFRALLVGGRLIDVSPALWLHECGEQAFIELYGDHYFTAHKLITIAEHDLVVNRFGHVWPDYTAAFEPFIKADEHEEIKRSPPDLFLRPYEDAGDFALLNKIKATM